MGFVTNRWQPVNAGPGPIPVPTWEKIKNNVTATTNFSFSNLDYTEYLILVYRGSSCYEFFYIPEFGTVYQHNGDATIYVEIRPTNSSTIAFFVQSGTSTTNVAKNYKYNIWGRKKTTWSLVSDNSSLPEYTELATCNGYYTPFNYQFGNSNYARTSGGGRYSTYTSSYSYSNYHETIFNNAYTYRNGNGFVYTRQSANESSWNHITSTASSVSIENISWSEMFIVGWYMLFQGSESDVQVLYLIPDMLNGVYSAGAYTGKSSGYHLGSWGSLTISDTSISASYSVRPSNRPSVTTSTFEKIDIYYR